MQENIKISKIDKKEANYQKIINFYKIDGDCFISFGKISQSRST